MRRLALLLAISLMTVVLPGLPVTAQDGDSAATVTDPVDCLRELNGIDLQHVTILGLQEALEDGTITSRQLVERYLARIEAFDFAGPELNGVRMVNPAALEVADQLDAERAAGNVRGPLHGIPILLKDNIGTNDMPTTGGSIALEDSIPEQDSFMVQQLRAAGAIILGKAELAEFANWVDLRMPNGYSSLGGQVLNSYNLGRNPSGSSSGSGTSGAMAYAAGIFGSETSGSILSPAEVQGLAAVKPTVGLISRSGVIPLAPSWDTTGPMVRNVTDAAVLLNGSVGADPSDARSLESRPHLPPANDYLPFLRTDALQGVRLGVTGRSSASAPLQEAYDELERQGATLVDVSGSGNDPTRFNFGTLRQAGTAELGFVANEFKAYLDEYLKTVSPPSGVTSTVDVAVYAQQHPDRYPYGSSLITASAAQPGTVPSTIPGSVAITQSARTIIDQTLADYDLNALVSSGTGNYGIGAAAGYPTVAVPAGATNDGRNPVNLAFLGTAWTEPQLLAYAYDYEQATLRRVPPTEVNADELATDACPGGGGGPAALPVPGPGVVTLTR